MNKKVLKKDTVIRRLKRALDAGTPPLQLKISKAIQDKKLHGAVFVINADTKEVIKDNTTLRDLLIENDLMLDDEDYPEN